LEEGQHLERNVDSADSCNFSPVVSAELSDWALEYPWTAAPSIFRLFFRLFTKIHPDSPFEYNLIIHILIQHNPSN
jgi:hypothetical protein